jgi:hypothetical protein
MSESHEQTRRRPSSLAETQVGTGSCLERENPDEVSRLIEQAASAQTKIERRGGTDDVAVVVRIERGKPMPLFGYEQLTALVNDALAEANQ